MPVHDLYDQRKQELERGGLPGELQYDVLPTTLRTQIRQILRAAIGKYSVARGYSEGLGTNNNDVWDGLVKVLRREFGVDALVSLDFSDRGDKSAELLTYIEGAETDRTLSVVELCCRYLQKRRGSEYDKRNHGITEDPQSAVAEINARFRKANVGYQFIYPNIVRVDSDVTHSQVIVPALTLLRDPRFKGAEDEFQTALRKHREGDDKGAVTDANCAFESAMKCVCQIHNWTYDPKARASDLIKVLRAKNLFPDYLERSFDQLQAILASGLPEVRNNAGSHGQGAEVRTTPTHVGAFAVHLSAAYIVYICEASKAREANASKDKG